MVKIELTWGQWESVQHALSVAAEQFERDAKTSRENDSPRLAAQFSQQAKDTREFIELIDVQLE